MESSPVESSSASSLDKRRRASWQSIFSFFIGSFLRLDMCGSEDTKSQFRTSCIVLSRELILIFEPAFASNFHTIKSRRKIVICYSNAQIKRAAPPLPPPPRNPFREGTRFYLSSCTNTRWHCVAPATQRATGARARGLRWIRALI